MKLQTLVIILILALVAAFAGLNWNTFVAPTELSLGLASVRVPLGLLMLGLLAALTALFLAFAVNLQARARKEAHLHARRLRAAQKLAEDAESSRYTKLRDFLGLELAKQTSLTGETRTALLGRIARLERDLTTLTEQAGNTLAAYIGEVEDRLERSQTPAGEEDPENES